PGRTLGQLFPHGCCSSTVLHTKEVDWLLLGLDTYQHRYGNIELSSLLFFRFDEAPELCKLARKLHFCNKRGIDHFFCDFGPLVKLSCSDTSTAANTFFGQAWILILSCSTVTLVSYSYIIATIVKIPTSNGRQKAFNTCASHLTVVGIFYGTLIFMYVRPSEVNTSHLDKMLSVFYSVVTPLLNPIIYSLPGRYRGLGGWLSMCTSLNLARYRIWVVPGVCGVLNNLLRFLPDVVYRDKTNGLCERFNGRVKDPHPLLMGIATTSNANLQVPMYIFICNLSAMEICYTTVIIPKMLNGLLIENITISKYGCFTQFYFVFFCGSIENVLLAIMGFDRYLAICHPLRYTSLMNRSICCWLACGSWISGCLIPIMPTIWVSKLLFCSYRKIDHFFCDFGQLVKLSCSDTTMALMTFFGQAWILILSCCTVIVVSYCYIVSTILKIQSVSGRQKAFLTCVSHFTVVSIFYGTIIFAYVRPSNADTSYLDKSVSVFYSVITPLLNPMIYSLRNTRIISDAFPAAPYNVCMFRVYFQNRRQLRNGGKGGLDKDLSECKLPGFTISPELQLFLFVVFLCVYLLTVTANVAIISLVRVDTRLHTPMYFFLSQLSFLEIWYTSSIVPKLLANLAGWKHISLSSCMSQIYFYFSLGSTEFFLLGVMAIDRYLAICNPLRYTSIMNCQVCIQATSACWAVGFLSVFFLVLLISRLTFCQPAIINHFFCDIPPLLRLSCKETLLEEIVVFFFACSIILTSLLLTVVSYVLIISTIFKISSSKGRQKAFSTCASHFTVATILYGTVIFIYVRPNVSYPLDVNKVMGIFNTMVTPLLNPIIYCLRNKEISLLFGFLEKRALKRYRIDRVRRGKSSWIPDISTNSNCSLLYLFICLYSDSSGKYNDHYHHMDKCQPTQANVLFSGELVLPGDVFIETKYDLKGENTEFSLWKVSGLGGTPTCRSGGAPTRHSGPFVTGLPAKAQLVRISTLCHYYQVPGLDLFFADKHSRIQYNENISRQCLRAVNPHAWSNLKAKELSLVRG
ncbi:olfactory receptor 6M1-like, partial [Pelobates cultripes]